MAYEGAPDELEIRKSPFGIVGDDVGVAIEEMLRLLDEDMSQAPSGVWQPSDHELFGALMGFEADIEVMPMDQEVWPEFHVEVLRTIAAFHGALPFSEAERGWLLRSHIADKTERASKSETEPPVAPSAEAAIVSNGVRTVVHGRELMRRWLAWRRQTDEFEGQGSITVAQEALQTLVGQMAEGPMVGYEREIEAYQRMLSTNTAQFSAAVQLLARELDKYRTGRGRYQHQPPSCSDITRRPHRPRGPQEHE